MTSLAWPRCLKLQESNRKLEEAHQLLQGTKSECQELLLGRRVGIGQESWGDSCCFFFGLNHPRVTRKGTCSEPRSRSNYIKAVQIILVGGLEQFYLP